MDPWTDGARRILERAPTRSLAFSRLLAGLKEEGMEVEGREAWVLKRLSEHSELFRILPDHRGPFLGWPRDGASGCGSFDPLRRVGDPWVLACPAPPPGSGAKERAVRRIQEGLGAWGRCLDEGSPSAVARWIRATREAEGTCSVILAEGGEQA